MKFGIHSPSWLYEGNIFKGVKNKVQRIEALGFDWFSVMDHMIQIPVHGTPEEPFMEGWTTLAALAAVTSKIRLGTLVSSTSYRNPALLAKMVATVDVISQGRITLGIGAGWYENEYLQYNFEYADKPSERIYRLEDAIRLIKSLWVEGRATYEGKYFRVENAILQPKPIQRPHPPILVGGAGEQLTLRVVARLGDACNFIGSPTEIEQKFAILKEHCENEQRDYNEIQRTVLANVLIAKDENQLKAKMETLEAEKHFRGRPLTSHQAEDLMNQYQAAGVQLLITSIYRNDEETLQILAELKKSFQD